MTDLEPQPVSPDTYCPKCGGKATDESMVVSQLSDLGYLHDDKKLECQDCGSNWSLGIPIGEPEENYSKDLKCESCVQTYALVHRIVPQKEKVIIHVKCPNCFHFWEVKRKLDDKGVALVGHPSITGDTKEARPQGYTRDVDGNIR